MEKTWKPLDEIAPALLVLNVSQLESILWRRIYRLPADPLPPITRDEDPTDVFVDSYHWLKDNRDEDFTDLSAACARLMRQMAVFDQEWLQTYPEALGELCYLCARIGALEAIPSIAIVAGADGFGLAILPDGEDLQNRALRSLAGLLIKTPEDRDTYRTLFENALASEHHAAIGLATLSVFWPDEQATFVDRANKHENERVRWVIENLSLIQEAWPTA